MSLPRMLDVSNWQPTVNWAAEAKEVVAVYVKVAQGTSETDAYAASHIKGARAAKIPVGGYLYCMPGVGSGEAQADRLLALAPTRTNDLRPCLDCEDNTHRLNPAQLAAWYLGAVTRIVAKLGTYPTIYGSPSYLGAFTPYHPSVFGRCPLWVADYGVPRPAVPPAWTSWQAWQWTDTLKDPAVPGGAVDDSYVAEVAALRIPGPVVKVKTKRAASKVVTQPWQLVPNTTAF